MSFEQFLEVIGYTSQHLYLSSSRRIIQYKKDGYMIYTYLKLCLFDLIDYYHSYMVLSLPSYMFGAPVLKFYQADLSDSSDSDINSSSDEEDVKMNEYEVFVSQLLFVFKTNDEPPLMTFSTMNGAQLRPFIDSKGRFFVGHIERYYPNLDTIIIRYVKTLADATKIDLLLETPTLTKIIDVEKRFDIRNGKSCKFGVYL